MRPLRELVLALLLTSCAAAGGERIEIPVLSTGVSAGPFESSDGWTVELTRAEIAFGPFWACSATSVDPEFCREAVLEMRETVVIDALAPEMRMLGVAQGRTGVVNSAMYDLGISWFPRGALGPNEGAPGGHSARFEGTAVHPDGRSLRFSCDLDLMPQGEGRLVRRGRLDRHVLESADDALLLEADARDWWRVLAFEQLFEIAREGEVVLTRDHPQYGSLALTAQGGTQPSIGWGRD